MAARQGHAKAATCLGALYYNGQGVPQSCARAAEWWEKAARQGRQGDPRAMHNLGFLHANGQGFPQSWARAAEWYSRAARLGHADAMHNLGILCNNGQGVPQDFKRAVRLLKQSLTAGLLKAGLPLGWNYEHGHGVPQSYQEARRLYALVPSTGTVGDAHAINALRRVDACIRAASRRGVGWARDGMPAAMPTATKKPKPNEPCSCGSGRKYKKCCRASAL